MPSLFSLIGSAWTFQRKQPALMRVTIWMLALPTAIMNTLARLLESVGSTDDGIFYGSIPFTAGTILLYFPAILLLMLVTIWGGACILLVGRRMIQSKAGRSRTSFAALRKEAAGSVIPLFLTGILRGCFTAFWGILLIVPGIIYAVRTVFYQVVIVSEDLSYRDALLRSKEVVHGRSWWTFFMLLGLTLMLYVPAGLIAEAVDRVIRMIDIRFLLLADLFGSFAFSLATLIFLLSIVELYGALRKRPQYVET